MRSINKIFNLSTKLKYHNSQERDKGGCDLQCHKPQGGPWLHVLLYSLDKVINIIIIVSFVKLNLTINERYFEYEDLSDVLFHPEPELLWALGEIISASGNSLELSFWIHNSNEGRIANMDLKLSRESWLKYKALPNYKFYDKNYCGPHDDDVTDAFLVLFCSNSRRKPQQAGSWEEVNKIISSPTQASSKNH